MEIGNQVSVIDENLQGVVKSMDGPLVTITTHDGFDLVFSADQLVIVSDLLHGLTIEKKDMEAKNITKNRPSRTKNTKKGSQVILEVDLHAEQLTKDHKRMQAYEILELQLDTAKRQVDFAIRKRIPKLILIHGVGAGVLRSELEFLLKRYDHLSYQDADYQKYGMGALEVYFIQNKRSAN